MSLIDFIEYVWVPMVGFLWWEIRDLRKKVEQKTSKEDLADYLEPRIQKVESSVNQSQKTTEMLDIRIHELIMTIMEWQRQQNDKK